MNSLEKKILHSDSPLARVAWAFVFPKSVRIVSKMGLIQNFTEFLIARLFL